MGARERSPGSLPARRKKGRQGSETPHDPRGPRKLPRVVWTNRPARRSRRPPEGPKRTKPAIDDPIIEFTGSPFHGFTGLRPEGSRDHRGCAFSAFVFCSFPASGREGPGAGGTSPHDRGAGWVVRMPGPGDPGMGRVGWIPGSPAGRTGGGQNEGQTPSCAFLQGPGRTPGPPPDRVPDGDRTVPSGD
jgi:hypothetical protein